jgi:PKD repeat protein
MNHKRVYGATCALFLILAAAASATTIVLPEDEQLVAKAPLIVEATVESVTPVDQEGAIWTETRLAVNRTLKGNAGRSLVVREPGGVIGDRITVVYGTPEFTPGEQVLLFLTPDLRAKGGHRVVDLFVGKFTSGEMTNGRRLWLRNDAGYDVLLLDKDFHHVHPRNVQRDAAGFERFVYDRIAGRQGVRNYRVENPVLKRKGAQGNLESDSSGSTSISSNFTLISEPTVYRWFRFDRGQTAQWYHHGSQPGYTDGGVSELGTGMAPWNQYSSAKINYSYVGTLPVSPAGMDKRNSYNEVLFNDPLNEIAGTWTRTSGGTVGIGGFNGVASGGMWTAPFTADASHPAGAVRAFEIVEANIVIQDGVSPANGISSSRLAEIIAHEFGHTLGFGHSADGTALMYASVTGLGPSLRDDDKLAARWLYPNGSEPAPTVTVPAAPSGLTATPSGSNLDLKWTDNATNETSQGIYLAAGTGSFSLVATVGTNVTTARISGLAGGSYRVYVNASNSAGTSAASNTVTASIASGPVAAFSFTPQSGLAGVTSFTFYDESTGGVTSRQWNFGDGSTSTAATPSKVYSTSGSYTVTLTVHNSAGSSSTSRTVSVGSQLSASFTFSPASPMTSDVVWFTDQSAGAPTSWRWAFSDGTVLTQQNPSRQFPVAGTQSVSLTIYRGSESSTTTRSITVYAPAPITPAVVAAFSAPATATAGTAVTLTDQSSGSPTAWSWSFGDGRTSTARNPSHSWSSPGTYHVTLTASNATSSSTATKSVNVTQIAAYRTLVSAAAQTAGIGGTAWRTELSLFNAGTQGANVSLTYVPSAGSTIQSRSLFLSPRQSVSYANALLDLYGIGNGAGAIGIEATSGGATADLRVTSRTFTSGEMGTYGQSVPDVQEAALERILYVTGIQSNAAFRTNIGLVNRGNSAVGVTLTLRASSGGVVASNSLTLGANSFQQAALASYFPAVQGGSYSGLTMQLSATTRDSVSAYASVVDNVSQDPVFIQATPPAVGGSLTLPVVGRAPGANGTFWRSDVILHNPGSGSISLTLRYGGAPKSVTLQAGQTTVMADVLSQFGHSSGSGKLDVTWSGSSGPVVTSRTYTSVAGGGTFGQSIDPVASFGRQQFVPGLRHDASYRTNIGFVNHGGESEMFAVMVLSNSGAEVARTFVTLAPGAQAQYALTALFPAISSIGNFTLMIEGDGNAQLFAYGSMVDNKSGDPVFFAGR